MKLIAQFMLKRFNEDAALKKSVCKSPEPMRALIWESGVFSQEFLEIHLDPFAPRKAELLDLWDELTDALDGQI